MKKIIFSVIVFCSLLFTGCINFTLNPNVQTVEPWEGHYYTVEEFKTATENLTLDESQSVWVLSNKSLSRALKNMIK